MPRKKILTKQNQWAVILLGGLCLIYAGLHWRNFLPVHTPESGVEAGSNVIQGPVTLDIPALSIQAPVIYSKAGRESEVQTELESGVVLLSGTARPGEAGNAYIVGHSSNYNNAPGAYNEVFKTLPDIRVGDEIKISMGKRAYTYEVFETRTVEPTELWVMSQDTAGAKILTLQTSYPVGTADRRFVAIAKLRQ